MLVIGESLGAGVAAMAAARQRDKVAGLLLITPWDRLERIAGFHYPGLPVKWLLRDRYDSAGHPAAFGRPSWWPSLNATRSFPAAGGQTVESANIDGCGAATMAPTIDAAMADPLGNNVRPIPSGPSGPASCC